MKKNKGSLSKGVESKEEKDQGSRAPSKFYKKGEEDRNEGSTRAQKG